MANERFGLKAREQLAAYIAANIAAHLATVEAALALPALSLGRPAAVIRGYDPKTHIDNKVEVYVLGGGFKNAIDRQLFDYRAEVAFTLLSSDAQVLPVQERLLRWEWAWWLLMGKGGTTCGGTVVAAISPAFTQDTARAPNGNQFAVGVAPVAVTIQEA